MDPSRYNLRVLLGFSKTFVFPITLLSSFLKLSGKQLGIWLLPAHLGFIVLCSYLNGALAEYRYTREAAQLNAKRIPRVIGKWPGNIDILLQMLAAFKDSYVMDVYLRLFEEYQCTTLNLRILWSDTIITMDQEHQKFILATGFSHFWRGRSQKERMETFLGEGIFNRDDEIWKMHRSNARPFFARERILDFDIFEKHFSRTHAIISNHEGAGEPTEAQDLLARFTLDASSEFLFGTSLDTMFATHPVPGKTPMGARGSATVDEWGSFAGAFEMAQQVVTNRARIGYLWPLFELSGDKMAPHAKLVRDWLDPLVKRAIEDKQSTEKAGVSSQLADQTFLEHLVDYTQDPILIRDQLLNMLLAARDTTACVLTYVLYFLAIHPEITERLRAEILDTCGPCLPPTYDQIRQLKYMRAVLNETMRLFPPVPLNVRETRPGSPVLLPASDATYLSGDCRPIYVPGGTHFTYMPLLMQRNKALWGPDADEFDPDRWMKPERVSKFVNNPAMFTPFSAGPRICIGQNYAYNEASYFLVRLLQNYERFTLAPEFQPEGSLPPSIWKERQGRQKIERIWPGAAMTLFVKGGMWIRFHKAST